MLKSQCKDVATREMKADIIYSMWRNRAVLGVECLDDEAMTKVLRIAYCWAPISGLERAVTAPR